MGRVEGAALRKVVGDSCYLVSADDLSYIICSPQLLHCVVYLYNLTAAPRRIIDAKSVLLGNACAGKSGS